MLVTDAAAFIAPLEGFRARPYKDGAGNWTIGFGTCFLPNGAAVTAKTNPISEEQGIAYLEAFISQKIIPELSTLNNWNRLNINQQVACVSMAYNIGVAAFMEQSSVAKAIEGWVLQRVPADIMLWDKVTINGKLTFDKGLYNRRLAEEKLFTTPVKTLFEGALS